MSEETYFGGCKVVLDWLTAEEFLALNTKSVTSCFLLPKKEDKIGVTLNPRGVDFIGGHLEEESPYDCMVRETLEESSIKVKSAKFLGAIQVVHPEWNESITYPETGYQLFYVSEDYEVLSFKETHECTGRDFLSLEDIKSQHHNLLSVHIQALEEAV